MKNDIWKMNLCPVLLMPETSSIAGTLLAEFSNQLLYKLGVSGIGLDLKEDFQLIGCFFVSF
jgi:hypothetical protein